MGFLFCFLALSQAFSVELKNLSFDYLFIKPGSRFLESPTEKIESTAGLNVDVSIVGPVFWNNRFFLYGGQSQVEWVGYNFRVGLTFFEDRLRVYYEHQSQHRLDRPHTYSMFPVYDGLGATWRIK